MVKVTDGVEGGGNNEEKKSDRVVQAKVLISYVRQGSKSAHFSRVTHQQQVYYLVKLLLKEYSHLLNTMNVWLLKTLCLFYTGNNIGAV